MSAPTADVDTRAAEIQRLREWVLILLVVTIPIAAGTVIWSSPGGAHDFNRRVSIRPFDIALVFLVALWIVDLRRPRDPLWVGRWTKWIASALGIAFVVAFVVHPSPRGIDFGFRVVAALATLDAIVRLSQPARRRVLTAIVAAGAAEAIISMAESVHGGTVGLKLLEFEGFFYSFGTSTAGHAGFDHPYGLACFLLVTLSAALVGALRSDRRGPWLVGAAVIAMGLATTYSRAALISLVIMLVVAVVGGRRSEARSTRRRYAAVVAGAFFVGVLAFGNGWFARAESTTAPGASASDIGTGRTERFREALRLVKKEPIFGVGPGRYTIALESVPYGELLPAHDAMLHEAAEAGVVGGVLTAALLLALALDACRAGANTMIVFGSILMFFLVDSYPYVFPAGIAFAGLWLGLQHLASEPLPAHD